MKKILTTLAVVAAVATPAAANARITDRGPVKAHSTYSVPADARSFGGGSSVAPATSDAHSTYSLPAADTFTFGWSEKDLAVVREINPWKWVMK